jgi:replicative DNA helicase
MLATASILARVAIQSKSPLRNISMHTEIINEMVARGWSMHLISSRTGINQGRLESGKLGVREQRELARVAESEAGISIDDLEGDE